MQIIPRQESAAPKAQGGADDAADVCQKPSVLPTGPDQFAAASFANGKLFRPTATWAHGSEALLPGLTTSSNWSDSTKGTNGSMGHHGSMGASPRGRGAVLSGVRPGSMNGHFEDAGELSAWPTSGGLLKSNLWTALGWLPEAAECRGVVGHHKLRQGLFVRCLNGLMDSCLRSMRHCTFRFILLHRWICLHRSCCRCDTCRKEVWQLC